MVALTFPDRARRAFPNGATGLDIAKRSAQRICRVGKGAQSRDRAETSSFACAPCPRVPARLAIFNDAWARRHGRGSVGLASCRAPIARRRRA
jgi:hypothetical protein